MYSIKTLVILLSIIAALFVLSVWGQHIKRFGFGEVYGGWHEILVDFMISEFYMDDESNVPTYFNTALLIALPPLFFVIFAWKQALVDKFRYHWFGLVAIFLFLSMDEAASLHERLIKIVGGAVSAKGIFHFPWLIPGLIAVAVFFVLYLVFFLHLDTKFKILFLLSFIVYLMGVIGGEMVSGYFLSIDKRGFPYAVATSVEETLEMTGVAMMIYSLLEYIKTNIPDGFTVKIE
jgi:hypothetical protein